MIVPDTNILITYLSRRLNIRIRQFLDQLITQHLVLFSVVAVAEFLVRATEEESRIMQQMIDSNKLVSLDQVIMEQAVLFRKEVLQKSKRVLLLDCFIAATAKVHKATLLTFDRRDYPFPDITVREPKEIIHNS